MTPSEPDERALHDLLTFAATAARLVDRGKDAYDRDEMLRLAAEAIIHRVGEAVARVSDDLVTANPQVRWRGMKAMRNVVAHEYGAVDHELLWNALVDDLPRDAGEVGSILGR